MRKISVLYFLVAALLLWNLWQEHRLSRIPGPPFQPPLDIFVAERDTVDKGFSREYGFYMRPYCNFWSDCHVHTYLPNIPEEERTRQFVLLKKAMYELDIVNRAVFCETESELAMVDSMGKDVPVWWAQFNDPDLDKLRSYREKYHLHCVKLYSPPIIEGECSGDSVEFPLGSGKRVPIKIDMIISPEWMRFYAVCEELGLPILWHPNCRYGPSPYNYGGDHRKCWDALPYDNFYVLGLIERILDTYPKLNIILAHQGFMGYKKLSELLEKHPNLYIDTTAGFMLHDGDYLTDEERDRIRPFFIRWADRILFGTDANAYGAEMPQSVEEHEIRRHVYDLVHPCKRFIQQLYLPQAELSKVAHRNFERLFQVPPAERWEAWF